MANMTPDVANGIITIIDQHAKPALAHDALGAFPVNFCTVWPVVQPILTALAGFVVYVPTYGVAAAAILTGLIAVAQQSYAVGCATPPVPLVPPGG